MMVRLFYLLAHLPLPLLHRMGCLLGWISYLTSARYAARLRDNLRHGLGFLYGQTELPEQQFRPILRSNIGEAGKGAMELPWIWCRPLDEVLSSITSCRGWDHVETAKADGKGVILLTPHFGCFELINLYIASRQPMTTMYRRPRWAFLDILMHAGRARGQTKLVAADMGGVRQMLKALKRGEGIGVLPDQVPGNGEGEWHPFFGRPAYTMTLIGRLAEASGAAVIMSSCKRLPPGQGYELNFQPLPLEMDTPIPPQINAAMEEIIRLCPEQYLWSYNRYKVPRGAEPPSATPKLTRNAA